MVIFGRPQHDVRPADVVADTGRRGDAERVLEAFRLPGVVTRLRLVDQAGEPVPKAVQERGKRGGMRRLGERDAVRGGAAARHVLEQGNTVHGALGRAAHFLPRVHVRAHESVGRVGRVGHLDRVRSAELVGVVRRGEVALQQAKPAAADAHAQVE